MTLQWLAVAVGGALGSMMRFAAVVYLTPLLHVRFPIATFAVNVFGSLLIGVAWVLFAEKFAHAVEWRLLFMTGVLGGFTTFSAFSLETLRLLQEGQWIIAFAYVMASVLLCLLAAALGVLITGKLI